MNLYEFQLLCLDQQIDLLYKEGVYVGKQTRKNKAVILYQLDSFYVEVFYKKYRYFVECLHCFTSTELLHPYLAQVDADELMKCVG